MGKKKRETHPLFKLVPRKSLGSSIDRFNGPEHGRQINLIFGKELGKKLYSVNTTMDRGAKKGSKSHREYGHNREFIQKKYKIHKNKCVAAYAHLLGDFFQDILRTIVANVGEEFKNGKIKGPFYEKFKDGKWGWDIKKEAIEELIKKSSEAFIQALNSKNRIKGLHRD
jgi:hypothetical protein